MLVTMNTYILLHRNVREMTHKPLALKSPLEKKKPHLCGLLNSDRRECSQTCHTFFLKTFFFFTIPFLENGALYCPGSSKKMESAGLVGSYLFLNVHTKKRGRCHHSPISSLKHHCLPMVDSNTVATFVLKA